MVIPSCSLVLERNSAVSTASIQFGVHNARNVCLDNGASRGQVIRVQVVDESWKLADFYRFTRSFRHG